ncbi:DUF5946 family protein [Gemmatimonas phototrophica]|uniref:Uncharacterized protein n=1 Tax=Gemmatimonas phototrophica TaxID=1379270 RepID=A0A143BFV6_9BACT|nr:DUF5946 family protein [Gemmatimonas phototrophica]AMW03908.1 hypothetical protein GEMMAAP_01730 [Gemmatimonas phototrophica]
MSPDEHCPECGAPVVGQRLGCQQRFDECLAREFDDDRYARAQRLMVDAYSLQHPSDYMRSAKSFAAHLTGIYAALERRDAPEVNHAVQAWLNGPKTMPRPDHPSALRRGTLTILHVHEAGESEEHVVRVREWAQSVWEAWRSYEQIATKWIDAAIATVPSRATRPQ